MARTAVAGLPIGGLPRVNLLPQTEVTKRERERLTGKWVWGVFAAILVSAGLIVAAFAVNWLSAQRLAAEQAQTTTLLSQMAALKDVSSALATQTELQTFRGDAMASDLAWAPVFDRVSSALPGDARTTGFELTVGAAPVKGANPKTAVGLTGTVTFTSDQPADMAKIIRTLRTVPGVLSADGQSLASTSNGSGGGSGSGSSGSSGSSTPVAYNYLLDVTFDQTIYSGAYTAGSK